MIYKMPIRGEWGVWSDKDIVKWRANGEGKKADYLIEAYKKYQANKLSRFLPHGEGAKFINDRDNGICILTAINQVGKSVHGCIYSAVRIIQCNPNWPIFTENGIEYHEWEGPKVWIVASSTWDNVKTLWKTYQEFLPREELGIYAPNYPLPGTDEEKSGKRQKPLNFGDGKPKDMPLVSGGLLKFLCYSQDQMHWESFMAHGGHLDEQIWTDKFTGYTARTQTVEFPQCCMTLTGHLVPEKPDETGAGGFVHNIYTGREKTRWTVGTYGLPIPSVPDVILPARTKQALKIEWVDAPEKSNNFRKLREAQARYWGKFESSSGLAFPLWDRKTHAIPRLFDDNKIPDKCSLYRVIDHGDSGITCCSWWAVFGMDNQFGKDPFSVMYRLYYQPDRVIAESAVDIISMSGNERLQLSSRTDQRTGNVYEYWREVANREHHIATLLDPKSLSSKHQGQMIGDTYTRYGVACRAASGSRNMDQMENLNDLLFVDGNLTHVMTKELGAPRLYVFEDCVQFIDEIETLRADDKSPSGVSKKQAKHAIDTAKWFASAKVSYRERKRGQTHHTVNLPSAPHMGS